jgi:serine/threonine protein kinase
MKKLTIQDFDLKGVLGEGSYGKVFRAIDKKEKKSYAVKVLDKYHITKVK